jgi:hypothetical protein
MLQAAVEVRTLGDTTVVASKVQSWPTRGGWPPSGGLCMRAEEEQLDRKQASVRDGGVRGVVQSRGCLCCRWWCGRHAPGARPPARHSRRTSQIVLKPNSFQAPLAEVRFQWSQRLLDVVLVRCRIQPCLEWWQGKQRKAVTGCKVIVVEGECTAEHTSDQSENVHWIGRLPTTLDGTC